MPVCAERVQHVGFALALDAPTVGVIEALSGGRDGGVVYEGVAGFASGVGTVHFEDGGRMCRWRRFDWLVDRWIFSRNLVWL